MFQSYDRDNKTQTKYSITIIVMFPIIVMLLAWIALKMNIVSTTVNSGTILAKDTKLSDLNITIINKDTLIKSNAQWKLMLVGCSTKNYLLCKDMIYKTGQVIKALGKNSSKLLRIYVVNNQENRADLKLWQKTKNSIYAYDTNESLQHKLELTKWPEANVFLIDPLDRIIMHYRPEQTGKELLRDLKRLLHNMPN